MELLNDEVSRFLNPGAIYQTLNELDFDGDVKTLLLQSLVDLEESKGRSNISLVENYRNMEACLEFVWEKLNTGHWKDVNVAWRKLYAVISVMKISAAFQVFVLNFDGDLEVVQDLIKMCDNALLLGAPIMDNVCGKLASRLVGMLSGTKSFGIPAKRSKLELYDAKTKAATATAAEIQRHQNVQQLETKLDVGIEEFLTKCKIPNQPIVIRGALQDWPALQPSGNRFWSVDYLKRVAGYRTVPVELGSRYTDDDWTQTLMTVNDFVDNYLVESPKRPRITGYLAQHNLFDQIPELREDFDVPEYCFTGEDEEPNINIWFGPEGTNSPLHTDPLHNCLCQVFGQKYVRLYPKHQSQHLYPFEDGMLSNTSKIDLCRSFVDIVREFPNFAKAKGFECLLNKGDLLYIPPGCWHFVKSLSKSCSISFWFN